ncbi:FAD-dependent oxidoreductase [Pandoraea norimbergensis]|uniref:Flavin-dependent monooxygenase n=1 Tax=Pandoraea norimbergensis TaxID=93219 RepID=A0ABN4JM51_9BURK|nr:NAD(P)/FAD-dependent oxidoreductase [Pandoraea norimbergensis]
MFPTSSRQNSPDSSTSHSSRNFPRSAPQSARRIAIVGAGPAGLVAARILQLRGFHPVVFEAEASTSARDQGGTLDLHVETGQKALELAGLHDTFVSHARYDDQGTRMLDYASAQPLFEDSPPSGTGDRPEIDRRALRDLLLASLLPDTVRWGHKLVAVEAVATAGMGASEGESKNNEPAGQHVLRFANGAEETFDLVIGADGAWSKIRAKLSDVVPVYTGVTFVECWLDEVDTRHPEIAALVGRGTMFSLHDNMGLIAQRNGGGHVRVYAAFRRPENWADALGVNTQDPAQMRAALLQCFAGWSPQLLALISSCLDVIVTRPIYTLPGDFGWRPVAGLTLLGDAAHLLPPVGFGVNLAMLDAAELATALTLDGDWTVQVAQAAAAMKHRANEAAPEGFATFDAMFSADSAETFLQIMQSH